MKGLVHLPTRYCILRYITSVYFSYQTRVHRIILQEYFEFPASGPEVSEVARSLISGLICERETRLGRQGPGDFWDHPFFSGLDWGSLHQLPAPFQPEVSNPTDTSNFDVLDDCLSEMVLCTHTMTSLFFSFL